ncbi:MAG: URC4/urg3 family protein [Scytonematopsis contorta HA4267-MV1]|jgi:hypothetical protein|nr:URC4/urg3 family protein [Scytonematopsis contorta HA4267-MV1]
MGTTSTENTLLETIAYLRSPISIRERCGKLFDLVESGKSSNFNCDLSQLERVADYVIDVINSEYPNGEIPFHSRWRHFEAFSEALGVSRLNTLDEKLAGLTPLEKAYSKFDLVILSVLLDAGAGSKWCYYEHDTGLTSKRSEGLAIASFHMFCQGFFSSNPANLLQGDAQKLQSITEIELAEGFQVTTDNPLVGLDGRLNLLQRLGKVLLTTPDFFGQENPRPGNLVNYFLDKAENNQIAATTVLTTILEALSNIWPGRVEIAGVNLGDVWQHSALNTSLNTSELIYAELVPFHKLSQWLTYSLLEPLQELGLEITGLDTMTGLPEYRNGGLCIDLGLIKPKQIDILHSPQKVSSEVIVEWRALTVIFLDKIAATVRKKLDKSEMELPLVKILQGGTWTAGRKIAVELRPGGIPPIQIESDGTVF